MQLLVEAEHLRIIIIKLLIFFPPPVSFSSPSDATFTQAFPEEKEEGATLGEETKDTLLFNCQLYVLMIREISVRFCRR